MLGDSAFCLLFVFCLVFMVQKNNIDWCFSNVIFCFSYLGSIFFLLFIEFVRASSHFLYHHYLNNGLQLFRLISWDEFVERCLEGRCMCTFVVTKIIHDFFQFNFSRRVSSSSFFSGRTVFNDKRNYIKEFVNWLPWNLVIAYIIWSVKYFWMMQVLYVYSVRWDCFSSSLFFVYLLFCLVVLDTMFQRLLILEFIDNFYLNFEAVSPRKQK